VTELATCGIAPDQIKALRTVSQGNEEAKNAILEYLEQIGYPVLDSKSKPAYGKEALTFLRKDEAEAFLTRFPAPPEQPSQQPPATPDGNAPNDTDAPAGDPSSVDGERQVACDMFGEMKSDSYCLGECNIRKEAGGWCPNRGEDPPEAALG